MITSIKQYLNADETRLVFEYRAGLIRKGKKQLQKRKLNHFHKQGLRFLQGSNPLVLPDVLFLIRFRRYVSPYLYIYLKSISEPIHSDTPFSKPTEVNITKLASIAKCSRNTFKAAYDELIELGLVLNLVDTICNKPRVCSVVDCAKIITFDEMIGKVIYRL